MNSSIKLCIDVARVFNERTGKKDARFYKQDWLARTWGIYRKPHYPKQLEYACTSVIEALWKQYKPASEDFCERAALLASWLSILYPDSAPLSGDIVSRYNYLVVSQSIARSDAKASGYSLNITEPFDVIARDLEDVGLGGFVHIEDLAEDEL
jgi:hypothetical protein